MLGSTLAKMTPASRVKPKILPNMWIFTIKMGLDSQPERHKARVVIKGFCQRPGFEFDAVLLAAMRRAGWEVKELSCEQLLSLDMQLTLEAEDRTTQIILSQHNAITALVERFDQCKAHEGNASVPMLAGAWTGDAVNSALLPNNKLYISRVGSLIYLSTCTRPDIAYAVGCLSRCSAVPTRVHWQAADRLLIYLKLHKDCTAEYQQALSNAAREVQWIKQLRNDLGLPCTLVTIRCDSQGALSWTGDWMLEPKAKHIDIIHHYIKCLVENKCLADQ
eukprot:gene4255-biopygen21980